MPMETHRRKTSGRKAGRPVGASGTRDLIATEARRSFATHGFERTTIRDVAAAADVTPALVMHYFGSKERLFVETMAIPFDPAYAVATLLEGERSRLGFRLAAFLLDAFDDPRSRAVLLGRIRAAVGSPDAAALVREKITGELIGPLSRSLGVDEPDLRAGLASTALMGFAVTRFIVEIDAVAALTRERAEAYLGRQLQQALVEPLEASTGA
jgi:AcrR family transcriptional regulator